MKEYIRLSVDVEGYYSGSTYHEEVFLPKETWEEIKDNIQMHTYIYELDGKHSEVKADIEVEEFNEKQLTTYQPFVNDDGEDLFYHIYEYLPEKYDREYLGNIQDEVSEYSKVDVMTIKFNKQHKDKILELLKDYLL
jgi:hypothetical protein